MLFLHHTTIIMRFARVELGHIVIGVVAKKDAIRTIIQSGGVL